MKKEINNFSPFFEKTPIDVFLGRAAMLGFVLGLGAYLTADIVAPGFI